MKINAMDGYPFLQTYCKFWLEFCARARGLHSPRFFLGLWIPSQNWGFHRDGMKLTGMKT
jgi:hypothetical protein